MRRSAGVRRCALPTVKYRGQLRCFIPLRPNLFAELAAGRVCCPTIPFGRCSALWCAAASRVGIMGGHRALPDTFVHHRRISVRAQDATSGNIWPVADPTSPGDVALAESLLGR